MCVRVKEKEGEKEKEILCVSSVGLHTLAWHCAKQGWWYLNVGICATKPLDG